MDYYSQFHQFYAQIFRTKVLHSAFLLLRFGFVIFWQKDIGIKSSSKMLMKLSPRGRKKRKQT